MLVRVTPEQVSELWDFFAEVIEVSLPPVVAHTVQGMGRILYAVLAERLHVWYYDDDGDANFVMTTTVWVDPITEVRSLLVYSFTAIYQVTPSIWEETLDGLRSHAKAMNCSSIVAFVANDTIVKFMERQGAKTDYTLIELEV